MVTAERRSQAERRDEAERKLLKAAITLIAERGLERLTLTEVGEAAGYSRGLPAHYFGGKSGLIVTLAQQLVDDFARALDSVEQHAPGLERLIGTVRYYFDSALKDPVGTRALFVLLGDGLSNPLVGDQLAELNTRSAVGIQANLEAAVRSGEAQADIDIPAQALLILASLRGAVNLWLLSPDSVDLMRVRDAMASALERSLAA